MSSLLMSARARGTSPSGVATRADRLVGQGEDPSGEALLAVVEDARLAPLVQHLFELAAGQRQADAFGRIAHHPGKEAVEAPEHDADGKEQHDEHHEQGAAAAQQPIRGLEKEVLRQQFAVDEQHGGQEHGGEQLGDVAVRVRRPSACP